MESITIMKINQVELDNVVWVGNTQPNYFRLVSTEDSPKSFNDLMDESELETFIDGVIENIEEIFSDKVLSYRVQVINP